MLQDRVTAIAQSVKYQLDSEEAAGCVGFNNKQPRHWTQRFRGLG